MIRDENLGLEHVCRIHALLRCHCERLVHREEGDVYVLEIGHLRNVLGVTGGINPQAVDGKNVTVTVTLGMILKMSGSGVVSRNSLKEDVLGQLTGLAIADGFTVSYHVAALLVEKENCLFVGEYKDGGVVQVISVFMGDKDKFGLSEVLPIVGMLAISGDWIHLYSRTFVFDSDGTVFDEGDVHIVTMGSFEGLDRIGPLMLWGWIA